MAKVNTLNPRSFESIIGKLSQSAGLDKTEVIQLRSAFQKVDLTLNDDGSVKQQANVSGRTEPLSTTLTHVAATGNLDSLANVNDTSTDLTTDGSFSLRSYAYVDSTIVDNANFEASAQLFSGAPPGWTNNSPNNTTLSYETANPASGNQSLKVVTTQQFGGAVAARRYKVIPGDVFHVTCSAMSDGTHLAQLFLGFYDKNDSQLSVVGGSTTSATWTTVSGAGIAPANSVYALIALEVNSVGGGTAWFDNVHAVKAATAFEMTPINTAGTPTASTALCSQSGTSTLINVAASTWQFGDGQVSYNSGSIDPGSLGTYYIYADDPGFQGGAVTYQSTTSPSVCNAGNGRLFFGKITTTGGGSATSTGGGSGGGGPVGKQALA